MKSSEIQKEKVERLAIQHDLTSREYKRRCDVNTARNKCLTPAEYSKKRVEDAANKKNMTVAEYKRQCYEKSAINKGFKNYKDYCKAYKRAKKRGMSNAEYYSSLEKDENGFYIL